MIKWLKSHPGHLHVVYKLDEIKEKYEVRKLGESGYLVLNPEEYWLNFAVMQFNSSDGDGSNIELEMVFYGDGPPGPLRECRHTYWGEGDREGYMFYPKRQVIIDGLNALTEFFDMD